MTLVSGSAKGMLVSELKAEYEKTQLRLRELAQIIGQSQAEVRRLQQKTIEVQTQMTRIEQNFDTVPRADIKATYNNVIDTKTRLLTMQSQLEKVQQDQSQLETFSKQLGHFLEMVQDVSDADISLKDSTSGISGGANTQTIIRMLESQESERLRLARQLHDGPAQSLTNFILQAEICQRLFDRNPDRASEELGNLKTSASSSFQKVRDFIFDLRPMMLDDLGLAPTVRRYVEAFGEKSGIEMHLNIVGEDRRRMESHIEVLMFRGLQELFNYAREHVGTSRIDIVLDITGSPIKANVTFNGKNIDELEIEAEQNGTKTASLNQLKERIELVGGMLDRYGSDTDSNRVDIILPAGQV
jgi:two-component system sensor histidine kinase DegS